MTQNPFGHRLAAAAVAVALPLLALATLEAHGQPVAPLGQALALWASAIGFALAVTGGAVYVMWHLPGLPPGARGLVVLGWVLAVLGEAAVLVPWIVLHLRRVPLGQLLVEDLGRWAPWAWSSLWTLVPHAASATVVVVLAVKRTQAAQEAATEQSAAAELLAQREAARAEAEGLRARIAEAEAQVGSGGRAVYPRPCGACGQELRSQQHAAAHVRYCSARTAAQGADGLREAERTESAGAPQVAQEVAAS